MLAIFLKYPTPGKVKTRIAKDTDNDTAAKIYELLAEDVIDRLRECQPTLYYAGCSRDEIENWLPNFTYELQSEGDLGRRLIKASEDHFKENDTPLIIVGTDCVEISPSTINETYDLLKDNDLVVGPTDDGGYYLIAIKKHTPQLFQDIDWSSEKVFRQTIEKGDLLGLMHKTLSVQRDIDHWHQVPERFKQLIG